MAARANNSPKSYSEAVVASQALLRRGRLADPGEHYPYKRAVVDALLEENPPMGPGMPGGEEGVTDRSRDVSDYMSPGIAAASEAYVTAQAEYLADPSEETRAGYDAATDQLQAARLDHRANRGSTFTVGGAARRAG